MDPISDRVGKTLDFSTLQTNMKRITEQHFRSAIGRIAMRMVPCKNVCNIAFQVLCQVRRWVWSEVEDCGCGLRDGLWAWSERWIVGVLDCGRGLRGELRM